MLFARAGIPKCPKHQINLEAQTISQMVDGIVKLPTGEKIMLLSPIVQNRKGNHAKLLEELNHQGFLKARVDGVVVYIDEMEVLNGKVNHTIEIIIDRLKIREDMTSRLSESLETALNLSAGLVRVASMEDEPSWQEKVFSAKFSCVECGYSLSELEPRLFSFNNPVGACQTCDGLGVKDTFDEQKVVANPSMSLADGAVYGWGRSNAYFYQMLILVGKYYGFSIETPYEQLSEKHKKIVLYGGGADDMDFSKIKGRKGWFNKAKPFEGIIPRMMRRYEDSEIRSVREELSSYVVSKDCGQCHGDRLNESARNVFIDGQNLSSITKLSIAYIYDFFKGLKLEGAKGNNLNKVDLSIPVGVLTCVTGVSGSGKSTLINDTLYALAARELNRAQTMPAEYESVKGLDYFDKIVNIDQSPIGRTPRSNPATYTGVFSLVRDLFSQTLEARTRGYKAGRFSFNVKGGRCEACKDDGLIKVEMHFLPDVYVSCDVCKGQRYNQQTLEVLYKGKSIAQVLDMTVKQACEFFQPMPKIKQKLQTLMDVGLSYITLGQNATTLSGGEAQRIKLAKELSKMDTGQTLYILDEPTTGLHFHDIKLFLSVINRLRERNNTIVIIEHNLDVIKTADWIVDLGPEGGNKGGQIVTFGTPEEVAQVKGSYTGEYLKAYL